MPQCCSSTMRLSQTHVHANGDDVWTWRKISNPRPAIAEPAYITLGRVADLRHNLTVYRIPWSDVARSKGRTCLTRAMRCHLSSDNTRPQNRTLSKKFRNSAEFLLSTGP